MAKQGKLKEPESIVPCIKAGESQCCIGEKCPLYEECFDESDIQNNVKAD